MQQDDYNTPPTRQEMFNRAFLGLASQGWMQAISGGTCRYATPDGRRCAWGWVDRFLTSMHGGSVWNLRSQHLGIAAIIPEEDMDFARRMQNAHDCLGASRSAEDLEYRFRDFAKFNNLTIPEVPSNA